MQINLPQYKVNDKIFEFLTSLRKALSMLTFEKLCELRNTI